ncbi:nuclear transport factor 2 family protein [Endozoicomonas sp.]|uniref:nuclear transport factor 2 family protein n=1 Tax=Endozoicomonas sp. TaxID=1892382 RepID=UPI002888D9D9|nr:nuclear transport factor 2 family protein [Endozoicomonas sp.]
MTSQVTGEALAPFKQLIHDIGQAFKEKDISKAMAKFVAEDDITSFGLYADINSKSELEQHWKDYFSAHEFMSKIEERYTVYVYGEAACLCLTHKAENSNDRTKRMTLFLENHNGAWLIRHRHHSFVPEGG